MTPVFDIELTDDALVVRLRGLAALGALRRRVEVPLRLVESVEVGALPAGRPVLWRLGGLAAGSRRVGTFRRAGRWLFLALDRRDRVVRLRLDGRGPERVRFAEVLLSPDDPEGLADAIRARLAAGGQARR
jgi:hypothetical protein